MITGRNRHKATTHRSNPVLKSFSPLLRSLLSKPERVIVRGVLPTLKRRVRSKVAQSIEAMEERALLSSFTVANTADSGDGSLRQALLDANAQAGADTIEFSIGSGEQTIRPLSVLPEITDPVSIDGSTQPGYVAGSPLIIINGGLLPAESFLDGLTLSTSNSLIKGLVINGFAEGAGIVIGGFGSTGVTGNHVEGNLIGLNIDGTAAVPNSNGIRISNGASQNVVGGPGAAGNVISGNGFGIAIGDAGTTANQVLGNAIGTSRDRTAAIGNGYGVGIGNGGTANQIGGTGAGEGNLISGNVNNGILIDGAASASNLILGNRIGTNDAGTASLGAFTTSSGIGLSDGTHDNIIGGTTPGARNQIAGLASDGIAIAGAATTGNIIQGNYIGASADGMSAVANNGDGIFILNSPANTIGGDSAAAGNVISGSARHGVTIFGVQAIHNVVWANYIGTNATGTAAVPNSSDGVRIDGASHNTIGGSTPVRANLISGNGQNGVTLTNAGAQLNTVQGNLIGVAANAITSLGNGIDGVGIDDGATNNLIGGVNAPEWNFIAYNAFKGVEVSGTETVGNSIVGNRIFSNQFLEIDLNSDGITANDALDADSGPNGLQNFPVLTSVNAFNSQLFVTGTLNSRSGETYTLSFYSSAANDGSNNSQGEVPIGQQPVSTNASGVATFTVVLPFVTPGHVITATATDSAGNTSEFSASQVVGNTVPVNPILDLPGPPLSYQLNQAAIVVDATATVTDADSANFDTGKLTVTFNSKGEGGEKLKVRNQGAGTNQIGVKGTKVSFQGGQIGKSSGGSGKKPLVITFNTNATPIAVTALLKNITYVHTGKKTKLETRTLQFQVIDEAGHGSNTVNKIVTLSTP